MAGEVAWPATKSSAGAGAPTAVSISLAEAGSEVALAEGDFAASVLLGGAKDAVAGFGEESPLAVAKEGRLGAESATTGGTFEEVAVSTLIAAFGDLEDLGLVVSIFSISGLVVGFGDAALGMGAGTLE